MQQGGVLMVSRATKLHSHIKGRLEVLGFQNVDITEEEKDSLNMVINEKNPHLILMGTRFYQCSTPYMMGELLRNFPKLNIAAVSICDYPADLAMYFIINGVKSYVNYLEGTDEFYRGLGRVREGKDYISPEVQEHIETRSELPKKAGLLTPREIEVIRLLANGFTSFEIADVLHISRRTVDTHKTDLYTLLNVRNENELIRVALFLGIIRENELVFFGGRYQLNPKPERKPTLRRVK
jgi:DNA-binding NarL/FixJ family response regulator